MRAATSLGILALALAACASPAPPPLTGRVAPGGPAGPAPTVQWAGRQIATTGLPAIARDGSAIVIAHRDNDGGRGNPNLTLIEKDRGDRAVRRLVVVTATEVDELDAARIEERFAQAARWLRDRHAAAHLVPLTALAIGERSGGAPASATGGGATVWWSPNQLVIERKHGAPLVRTTPASWLAPDHPMCRTCTEVCHNDAFLGGAYLDLERSVAVVVVSYLGSDTCWEPSSEHHVVAW